MSMDTLSIDGRTYKLDSTQQGLVEEAASDFFSECDAIDRANGDDGHFHGFNNSLDPHRDARARYEARVRKIMGVS